VPVPTYLLDSQSELVRFTRYRRVFVPDLWCWKGPSSGRGTVAGLGPALAEPSTNAAFVIFGVAEVSKAVKVLEKAAAAAGPST